MGGVRLCSNCPIFYKYGLVYPNPFFRMLQFSIGVILASIYVDRDVDAKEYRTEIYELFSFLILIFLIVGIFVLTKRFPDWDYMYMTYFTIPVLSVMIIFLCYVKKPIFAPPILQRLILYFSAMSLPFYISQRFCFAQNIVALLNLEEKGIVHLNLIKLLLSIMICIVMAIFFDFADKKYDI